MPSTPRSDQSSLRATNHALIEEFVAQADAAATTIKKYRSHLLEFCRWFERMHGDSADLVQARPGDVSRFMAYLRSGDRWAASASARTSQRPAASTRKSIFASVGSFYRYLVSVEVVVANPTAALDAPKVPHKPGLHLTAEEVRRFLAVRGRPRDRVQAYLLAYTGARAQELRTLRWRDVDWQSQTMRLLGKGDKYRVIDIHPRLAGELRRWYLYLAELAERNDAVRETRSNPDTDFVLLTSKGRALSHSTICRQVKWRATRAGLHLHSTGDPENTSAVHPHAFRRSFATILLNDGHHLDAVADVLGHASVDTTRKHYAFASTERRRATIHAFHV